MGFEMMRKALDGLQAAGFTGKHLVVRFWNWIKSLFGKKNIMQWGQGFGDPVPGDGDGDGKPTDQEVETPDQRSGRKTPPPRKHRPGYSSQGGKIPPLRLEEQDIFEAKRQMRLLAKKLASKVSRKRKHGKKKELPDFRSTFRKSLKYGGSVVNLTYKNKQIEKPRVLAILDTSGSMTEYARMLMLFLHAMSAELRDYDVYIFTQDYYRVTDILKRHDFETAMRQIQDTDYWGGGTDLNNLLGRIAADPHKYVTNRTTVILMSDFETPGIGHCAKLLSSIRPYCKQIIAIDPCVDNSRGDVYTSRNYQQVGSHIEKAVTRFYYLKDMAHISEVMGRVVI